MNSVIVRTKPVVDFQDIYSSGNVIANAGIAGNAPVTIASDRTRVGKRVFLSKLGNAVSPGGDAYVTFRLLINGSRFWPYDGSNNQWGDPSNLQDMPFRIELPQGALVEIKCDNSDTTNQYEATARIFIEYEDF